MSQGDSRPGREIIRSPMKRLADFLAKYQTVHLAGPADQAMIFDVIDRTTLDSGGLQISFERRPDFFQFLEAQSECSFVFLMMNADRTAHGLAVLSLRPFQTASGVEMVVYGSDLRTTPQLEREPRKQWRQMYADLIQNLHDIQEFGGARRVITAVWNDNALAQRALVKKNPRLGVEYRPTCEYLAVSVLGRLWRRKPAVRRAESARDMEWIRQKLLTAGGAFSWTEAELNRTLKVLNKDFADFLVWAPQGEPRAFCLPVDRLPGRKVILKSIPDSLLWLRRLVKALFGLHFEMGQELRLQLLLFHRDVEAGALRPSGMAFLHFLMNEERAKPRSERTQIFSVFFWGNEPQAKGFLKSGFIATELGAKLYDVTPFEAPAAPEGHQRVDEVEIGLL